MPFAAKIALLALPSLINLWAIWHAFHHKFPSSEQRMIWLAIGVFVPVIGGLAYFFIGRKRAGEHI